MAVNLHDMLDNGLTADLDHQFWDTHNFLGQSGAQSSRKKYNFHMAPLCYVAGNAPLKRNH